MPETAGPIIYQTNTTSSSKGAKPVGLVVRIVVGVLVLALLCFIVYQIYSAFQLFANPKSLQSIKSNIAASSTPTLSLVLKNSQLAVGNQVQIPISLNTAGKKIIGVDVVIKYDPQMLQATNSGTIRVFQPGKLFDEYPIATADPTRGQILVSGIASIGKNGFNGVGVLGTLSLTTLKAGQTTLKFDYLPNGTTDSNMIEQTTGDDILGGVEDLTLTIK